MYFARGFAEMQLASDFCNGIPLSDGAERDRDARQAAAGEGRVRRRLASFDTAMSMSTATDAATVIINRAARIAKARALLGMGLSNAAAAAALVTGIPTNFRYDVTASLTGGNNTLWDQPASQNRYIIGDSITGKDRSILVKNADSVLLGERPPRSGALQDRLERQGHDQGAGRRHVRHRGRQPVGSDHRRGPHRRHRRAADRGRGGAARRATPATMMTILNALRAAPQQITAPSPTATGTHPGWTTPVMTALTDPGTTDGRVNLLFREKAFWTFGRGQRLGDLRRLIRDYGRAADGSNAGGYPIGTHYKGGVFGVDLNCRSPRTSRSAIRTSPAASTARRKISGSRTGSDEERGGGASASPFHFRPQLGAAVGTVSRVTELARRSV